MSDHLLAAASSELPLAVIVDVDGTLAVRTSRSPYEESRVLEDLPNSPIIELVVCLSERGFKPLIVSGRREKSREDTQTWLNIHLPVLTHGLHMRKNNDNRSDVDVKKQIYQQEVENKLNVLLVLDDRNRTVELWRSLGLTCLQVREGDF